VQAPPQLEVPALESAVPEPTADEKTLAMLAHALQLISGFIAPLIILLVKRESKFVKSMATFPASGRFKMPPEP
jgi:hypothetical protein